MFEFEIGTFDSDDNACLFSLKGELGIENAAAIKKAFAQALMQDFSKLVIDLPADQAPDISFYQILLAAKNHLAEQSRQLIWLNSPDQNFYDFLKIIGDTEIAKIDTAD